MKNEPAAAGWTPAEIEAELYGQEEVNYSLEPEIPIGQDKANWHLRKGGTIRASQDALRSLFDAEIQMLMDRRDDRMSIFENQALWHERAVEMWHRGALAKGDAGKTANLPHGTSSIRASQPATEIFDEDLMRAWLAANDLESVVYPVKEPALSKAALKKAVAMVDKNGKEAGSPIAAVHPDTGEVVPGLRFRATPARHSVKVGNK